jgi:hypothetical protein
VDKTRQTLHIEPPIFRAYVASNPDGEGEQGDT